MNYLIPLLVAAAYLLGSIPNAVWIGRKFYGIDVREHGSHNAGATNTLRVLGRKAGFIVFVLDFFKGFLAVSLAYAAGYAAGSPQMYNMKFALSAAAVVGHIFPIFAGFKRTASLSQNKFDLLAAEANRELIENNLSLNVTGAYFQILLNKEIYRIALEQIQLTKEQEERTLLLIENGKAAESQLYDVRAQLADDELTATEAKNSLRLAFLDLAQLMELKGYEDFDIDSLGGNVTVSDTLSPLHIYQNALTCMPQIHQAFYSLQSKAKEVKIAKAGYYPTISFAAGINTGYYDNGSRLSETFRRQFSNNMQKSLCFTVSIPLFDRFSTRNLVRAARIEEDDARLALENEKKQLYKDIEQAYTDAVSAYEKYESTTKAVVANQEAHRYALEKYAAGKSTVFEYNEIKMKLADTLSKQSQAKYTYLLKKRILTFYSCLSLTNEEDIKFP